MGAIRFKKRSKLISNGKRRLFILCLIIPLTLIFTLIILPFSIWAESSKELGISLRLEEWLVLEVETNSNLSCQTGQTISAVQTEIFLGKPVSIRALLSIGQKKRAFLRGIFSASIHMEEVQPIKIRWEGNGDLTGEGIFNLEEIVFLASWQGQGIKRGELIFNHINEHSLKTLKGIFILSSI